MSKYEHTGRVAVTLGQQHTRPEGGEVAGVGVPVDVSEGVEVVVEPLVLRDLPVEAGDELGHLAGIVEVAAPVRR